MQAISLFLLMACSSSSAEPCRELVLYLRDSQWFELLARLLHLPEGTLGWKLCVQNHSCW